jgi:hypothetical protein
MIVAANGSISKTIADYVHAGLSVIRLHGIDDNGGCTCGKGDACSSPGKHTVGSTWQITADEEQVFEWWGDNPKHNVGLLLGPTGGVIDIEADDDAAEAELKRRALSVSEHRRGRVAAGYIACFDGTTDCLLRPS